MWLPSPAGSQLSDKRSPPRMNYKKLGKYASKYTLTHTCFLNAPRPPAPTRLMIPLSVRDASIIGMCFCLYSSITGRSVMQGGRRQKWPPHFPPFSLLSKPAPPPLPSIYSPFFFISAVLLFSSRSWVTPETG